MLLTGISCANGRQVAKNGNETTDLTAPASTTISPTLNPESSFALNFFKTEYSKFQGKNIFVSPMSLEIALYMLANGADEATAATMLKGLGQGTAEATAKSVAHDAASGASLATSNSTPSATANATSHSSLSALNSSYSTLLQALGEADPSIELSIANSLWTRKGLEINPRYSNTLKEFYNAETFSVDFSDRRRSVESTSGAVRIQRE